MKKENSTRTYIQGHSDKGKTLLLLALFWSLALSVHAQTIVKPTATGAGNGSTWENAIGIGGLETAVEAGGTVPLLNLLSTSHLFSHTQVVWGTTPPTANLNNCLSNSKTIR